MEGQRSFTEVRHLPSTQPSALSLGASVSASSAVMEKEANSDPQKESISLIPRHTVVHILIILDSGYVLQLVGTLHGVFLFLFEIPPTDKKKKKAVPKTMPCLTIDGILESKKIGVEIMGRQLKFHPCETSRSHCENYFVLL